MPARTRDSGEERVTPLELFFDLIFVFAITQVTGLVVADPTWAGLVRGLLVLSVLWWAWAAYAWLTNTIDPEEGIVRLAMFGAMGAMLIASFAVPDAFGDDAFLFACAYAIVRIAHLVLYAVAGRGDRELLKAVARLGAGSAVGRGPPVRRRDPRRQAAGRRLGDRARSDLLGPYVGRARGWHLSPGHFVERHGLIVIIALGESIVALGAGATSDLDAGVIVAALLGFAVASLPLVGVLRRGRDRRRAPADGDGGKRAARDGAGLLQLPPPADGRGNHPLRRRGEEDDGPRGRPAGDRSRRSRCAAASRSTSSRTSSSGSGTCAPSAGGGSWSAWCWWR